ncbi:hypothetical protein Val02_80660 [Virgisporangium aliadipatigenens]|uniref:Ankyrin repeat domain-containing protein n=1 Tax=Virgisporangium aliadipatigenens TaxID=741659 RepID=A0A8J3YWL6_9ACTN|nr:ankyrin repeat domain-containing protein [Virgisporangium aliadipatigenens]GIJ51180.1 hypothetical protein Val02_80660 [Virgisporangium aliadipatigenens]
MIPPGEAAGWLAARRYGLPAAVVERATALRLAGDWRGACAAAGVDVDIDLATAPAGVAEDLRHLVPDLLRWHFPREAAGGAGLLRPATPVRLATYERRWCLQVIPPDCHERPQRLTLRVLPWDPAAVENWRRAPLVESWEQARHLWDARHTDALRERLGGAERTPFFERDASSRGAADAHGLLPRVPDPPGRPSAADRAARTEYLTLLAEAAEARAAEARAAEARVGDDAARRGTSAEDDALARVWRAAGIRLDLTEPEQGVYRYYGHGGPELLHLMRISHATLVDDARRAVGDRGIVAMRPPVRARVHPILDLTSDGPVLRLSTVEHARTLPALPSVLWSRSPDLALLRAGRITPEALHPLVAAALFPDRPATAYRPPAPDLPAFPSTVRVRCGTGWHSVELGHGPVRHPDHTAEEITRERVLGSLGGPVIGCVAATRAWERPGRVPRVVRQLRHQAILAARHGDTDALVRLLDAGLDPRIVITRQQRTLLHLLACLDRERAPALVRRLVDAGLDVDATDSHERTPLHAVLLDGGSAALVDALLDAGADPRATDMYESHALHLLHGPDAVRVLPRLLAAGAPLDAEDTFARTPLHAAISLSPPAALVRGLLDAGARPVRDGWGPTTVAVAEQVGRPDLVALLDEG